MNKEKNLKMRLLLGWGIIISNVAILLSDYFSTFYGYILQSGKIPLILLHNLIADVGIFPSGLPWFFHIAAATPSSLYVVVFLWEVLVIICGVGILKLNHFAKKTFFVLCGIQIATFVFSRLLMFIALQRNTITTFGVISYFFTLLFPILYIFYLTQPKIKEQFK